MLVEKTGLDRTGIKELLAEYVESEPAGASLAPRLLGALIEYWAREKDHELRNDLFLDMVPHYALNIKTLIDLDRLKNRFIRIVAHDLSGPLNAIRGLSDILLTSGPGPLNEEQREYIETINSTSDGILSLVNELLDVSLIESGRLHLQIERGSLEKLIRERIQIHKLLAEGKAITLEAEYAELPDQSFDHNKIAQVIDNLLGNAIKFAPHDSRIFVSLNRKEGSALISVRDEGPGIHEQDQSIIFNEFEKLKAKPTGGEKCTGLGLAIAKKIVEAHHGTLRVESRAGSGSTFIFELPFEEDYE
jgi:signal transduction histidine kinase